MAQEHSFLQKPFALIIEDHIDLAEAFANALEEAGYEAEIINDGLVARTRLAAVVPAVVVLDLHLPNVSGEEIMQQIRSEEQLAQTQIIIVSADPLWVRHLENDSDLVLIKPISYRQLRDLSARLISR